jgi:Amt family ammonium transporter
MQTKNLLTRLLTPLFGKGKERRVFMATVADDVVKSKTTNGSRKLLFGSIGALVVGLLAGAGASMLAGASSGNFDPNAINSGDTAWVLTASALVMLMIPAVGFFYGGMVRSKNVVSVIKQSVVVLALISIQWVLFGYSLAFGKDLGFGLIGGLDWFGLKGVGYVPLDGQTIPHLAFMMFQGMFAIITPALIIGSFAERIRFRTLIVFVLLWATLVYDPIAHWVWNAEGWLFKLKALDFAGGTVVHVSSGFAALAAAIVVGKRLGYQKGETTEANNVPLTILGAAMLWFGWFGFNAGSALAANHLAVNAFVVTNTAAAAAALVWMALSWLQNGRPSALATVTGAVCGLVAITPASGYVGPLSSISIGVIGGLVTYLTLFLRNKFMNVDDTLDVWAAHGMGGFTGALLTGIFAEVAVNSAGQNGLLFGNPGQFGVQLVAVLVTAAYSFIVTFILLKILSVMKLRVNQYEEIVGLDIAAHGEEGYRIAPKVESPRVESPEVKKDVEIEPASSLQ